jgi:hypothetical protein
MLLNMTWRGEELNIFNTVEPATHRTRGRFYLAGSRSVRYTRVLESGMRGDAEREGAFGEKWDKCHPLIG